MRRVRAWLRQAFFQMMRKTLCSWEGRALVREAFPELAEGRPEATPLLHLTPYQELVHNGEPMESGRGAIFITSRFRSGSTMLWNVFRHVRECTAYYEPFNERRWFDPQVRGAGVDATHRGVTDYWREYEGLAELGALFDESWCDRRLYMDARSWAPQMRQYIDTLISRAPGRAVLQFNRVDFRLPWLRANFPEARLIHLYRHPRDQWCSTFQRHVPFPPDGRMGDYPPRDEFYLLRWARDLSWRFPFLDPRAAEHPYELFYFIWRLSYAYGRTQADHSVALEEIVHRPQEELERLLALCGITDSDPGSLASLIIRPRLARWREYADDGWFTALEAKCDRTLKQFLSPAATAGQFSPPEEFPAGCPPAAQPPRSSIGGIRQIA